MEREELEERKYRLLRKAELFMEILCELIPEDEEYRTLYKNEISCIQNYKSCIQNEDYVDRLLLRAKSLMDWIQFNEKRMFYQYYSEATKWEEWESTDDEKKIMINGHCCKVYNSKIQYSLQTILQNLPYASRRVMTILAQECSKEMSRYRLSERKSDMTTSI